jgi:cytidine deaminase
MEEKLTPLINLDDKVPGSGRPFLDETYVELLARMATEAKSKAIPTRSNLYVGASVLAVSYDSIVDGKPLVSPMDFYTAGNVEILWQESEHAEKNAIMVAVAAKKTKLLAVCVAAERSLFTPCGGCMDRIFNFGGPSCHVLHYNPSTQAISRFTAHDLMPYYPTRK